MPAMNRRLASVAACTAATLLVSGLLARDASAKKETYIFLLADVELGKSVPKEVDAQVTTRLTAAIEAHPDLDPTVPKGAPDPDTSPAKFKSYLKLKKRRAYKMNVKISEYSQTVEEAPSKPGSQYLTVRVSLRLFAETYPDRGLAIHGDGSATVKLEIGKTVRQADRIEANSSALDQACSDAIGQVLIKLRQPPPKKKRKK